MSAFPESGRSDWVKMGGKCSALLHGMLSLRREFDSSNAIDFA
jgi:hypothetical protein